MEEFVWADEGARRLRDWLRKVRRAFWKWIKGMDRYTLTEKKQRVRNTTYWQLKQWGKAIRNLRGELIKAIRSLFIWKKRK